MADARADCVLTSTSRRVHNGRTTGANTTPLPRSKKRPAVSVVVRRHDSGRYVTGRAPKIHTRVLLKLRPPREPAPFRSRSQQELSKSFPTRNATLCSAPSSSSKLDRLEIPHSCWVLLSTGVFQPATQPFARRLRLLQSWTASRALTPVGFCCQQEFFNQRRNLSLGTFVFFKVGPPREPSFLLGFVVNKRFPSGGAIVQSMVGIC